METEENKDVQAPEQDVAQPEAESAPPPHASSGRSGGRDRADAVQRICGQAR